MQVLHIVCFVFCVFVLKQIDARRAPTTRRPLARASLTLKSEQHPGAALTQEAHEQSRAARSSSCAKNPRRFQYARGPGPGRRAEVFTEARFQNIPRASAAQPGLGKVWARIITCFSGLSTTRRLSHYKNLKMERVKLARTTTMAPSTPPARAAQTRRPKKLNGVERRGNEITDSESGDF